MTDTGRQRGIRFGDACAAVLEENQRLFAGIDEDSWARAGALITGARAVHVIGSGRSGLAAQMAAMRLMHLGLCVHVAGEPTAPAIDAGDTLVAVSGSGATESVVRAAGVARDRDAGVVAVTTSATSALATRADVVVVLPATDKQDRSGAISRQYAGSLFEQAVLLGFDAQFQVLWTESAQSADRLWERHANIG